MGEKKRMKCVTEQVHGQNRPRWGGRLVFAILVRHLLCRGGEHISSDIRTREAKNAIQKPLKEQLLAVPLELHCP